MREAGKENPFEANNLSRSPWQPCLVALLLIAVTSLHDALNVTKCIFNGL